MSDEPSHKISLPAFIKMLTNGNITPTKAMAVAGKIYKTHNTPDKLAALSSFALEDAGVEKDLHKAVLAAVRKAGYKGKPRNVASGSSPTPSASKTPTKPETKPAAKRKRKRDDDLNELLPERPPEEAHSYGSLDFNEVLDEEVLRSKYTVTNRAPVMMAWAFVVAERLGFQREEALSIASVYTEMNAVSKGVSIGVYAPGQRASTDASRTGNQPYVELMGRRPLYQTASGHWRALSNGSPVEPASAFAYISRALRQTAPHVLGALRLLAVSFADAAALNARGFALYCDFRPRTDGWGARGEVRCAEILGLRGRGGAAPAEAGEAKEEIWTAASGSKHAGPAQVEQRGLSGSSTLTGTIDLGRQPSLPEVKPHGPPARKLRVEPAERDEFDLMLDEDDALFNSADLSALP